VTRVVGTLTTVNIFLDVLGECHESRDEATGKE